MTAFKPDCSAYAPLDELGGRSPDYNNMYPKKDNMGFSHDGGASSLRGDAPPAYDVNSMTASAPLSMVMQQACPPPQQAPQVIQVVNHMGGGNIQGPTSISMDAMRMQCPSCRQFIKTAVNRKSVCKTHMCALLLCIFCCPFFCLPYCCSSYRNTIHTCPNCKAYLGTYYT